jgi:hypothetical protein
MIVIDKGLANGADFQYFRAAKGGDPDCLHGVSHGHEKRAK